MSKHLRASVEKQKQYYINLLIDTGVFKLKDQQLHEYTLTELETEYKRIAHMQKLEKATSS
ncbi:hypothetical protein GCM10011391_39310 [Pullulanibacillus camelliae]|uniref:Fur-regulated basic protein FbpA n=1 Tax=Pullulanibacillus camelliae TaxID=1707096 RepID=A0A8J3E162_9BACL|nr:Fur-regulated basic protein FbpA [Pullulanibacillus camelliae]GGE56534.1 hypothetical protein GCM10011391_39310 [Pullulanibacillus camelliae]